MFNAYLRLYALFFDAIVTYGYAQASHLKKIGVNNNKIFTAPNSTMNPVDSFRFTAKGKIKMPQAGKRHGMIKRTNSQIRKQRGTTIMSKQDSKIVKSYMPYSLRT